MQAVGHLLQKFPNRVVIAFEVYISENEPKKENILVIDMESVIEMRFLKIDREIQKYDWTKNNDTSN